MKKLIWMAVIIPAIALTACDQNAPPTAIPTIVLDSSRPADQTSGALITASAQVTPVKKVNLSFPLTGRVITVEVETGDQINAGDTLVTLDTAILDARVLEAQANLSANESQYRYLVRVGTDEEHLKTAQADVDRAQASLDSAEATLAQASLSAPFSGTVASVDIAPFETVIPGQVVIVLGDLSSYQIETTDLGERDVPAVRPGQQVNVFIEALGENLTGNVVDIAPQSTSLGGDVVYKVTIELDQQPADLRWGMSAEVEIQSGD